MVYIKKKTNKDNKHVDLLKLTKSDAYRNIMTWVNEFMDTVQVSNLNDDIRASDETFRRAKQFCFERVIHVFDIENYLTGNPGLLELHEEAGKEPRIGFADNFQIYLEYFSDIEILHTIDDMLVHIAMRQQEMADVFFRRLQVWYKNGFEPNDNIVNTILPKLSNVQVIAKAFYEMSFLFNHIFKYIGIEYKHKSKQKRDDMFGNNGLSNYRKEPLDVDFGYSKNLFDLSKNEAYDGIKLWVKNAEEIIQAKRENDEDYQMTVTEYLTAFIKSIFGLNDWLLSDIPYIELAYQNGIEEFKINDRVKWMHLDFTETENAGFNLNPEFYEQVQRVQNTLAQQLFNRLQVWAAENSIQDEENTNILNDYSQNNNLPIIKMALSEMTELLNYSRILLL